MKITSLYPEITNSNWKDIVVSKKWGVTGYNDKRKHWFVKGPWQGKRRYFSQIPVNGGFLTCANEEMAQYLKDEINKEIDRGIFNPARYQSAKPLHMKNYAHRWLELKKPSIAHKTFAGYASYIKNWIVPGMGHEYLPDINYEKIIVWLNTINRSAKYRKNIYTCLVEILKTAYKSGYITQLPEHIIIRQDQKKIEWLSKDHQERILKEIPPRHRYIFQFLFLTGVRPSEARALRKCDIYDDHIIIAKTFAPVSGGEELKIVKQKREQPIPLYDAVQKLFDEMPITLNPFVFINPDTNRPYTKNINRDIWNPACQASLGYVFPLNNAGRHSFAHQMLAAGIDMETVSALLRHSTTTVTKNNYARPNLKVIGNAVNKVHGKK